MPVRNSDTPTRKPNRWLRRLLRTALSVFLLMNLVAFLHAWRFTHFTDQESAKPQAEELGWGKKIQYMLTGIPNPRPANISKPDTIFESVVLNDKYASAGWWIPVDSARGTVILLHGYGGEKSNLLERGEIFRSMGYQVLLLDFRGSGESPGRATSIGFHESEQVLAAYNWVLKKSNQPVYFFGSSMGAAAALRAVYAHGIQPAGLVLECPFGSLLQTTRARFRQLQIPSFPMAELLVFWGGVQQGFNGFAHNPESYAQAVKCPTLLFYGSKDPKVSGAETTAIFQALQGPKKRIDFPEAAHEDFLKKYREEWTAEVQSFLP